MYASLKFYICVLIKTALKIVLIFMLHRHKTVVFVQKDKIIEDSVLSQLSIWHQAQIVLSEKWGTFFFSNKKYN